MDNGVARLDSGAWGVRVAVATKVALALAFVVALTVPLDHLEGKGMGFRFPLFMLSAVVVPIAWRRRFAPYPATADVLVVRFVPGRPLLQPVLIATPLIPRTVNRTETSGQH